MEKNGPSDSMEKYFSLETIFGRVKDYADPCQIDFIFTCFDIGNDEYRDFVHYYLQLSFEDHSSSILLSSKTIFLDE